MDPVQQTSPAQTAQPPANLGFRIVGVITAIFGALEIILSLFYTFVVYPQILTLYSDLNVSQNPFQIYLPMAILFLLGIINIGISMKLFLKQTINKQRYFAVGLVSAIATLFLIGFFVALSTISIINPIYNLVRQYDTSNTIITPSPTNPAEKISTANPDLIGANWRTYTDTTYGFSIKYPPTWKLKEPTAIDKFTYFYSDEGIPFFEEPYYIYISEAEKPPTEQFGDAKIYSKKTLGEYTLYKTESLLSRSGNLNVYLTKDNKQYILLGFSPYSSKKPYKQQAEYEALFDQILSTFKFTP